MGKVSHLQDEPVSITDVKLAFDFCLVRNDLFIVVNAMLHGIGLLALIKTTVQKCLDIFTTFFQTFLSLTVNVLADATVC